jgi:hypothetical protein
MYEKPTVTRLGSLAEFTLYYTKTWGEADLIQWIPIAWIS